MRLTVLPLLFALAACEPQTELVVMENGTNEGTAVPDANSVGFVPDADDGQTGGTLGQCDFDGWSLDEDPKGLNVRAGPSIDAAIVGTLPPPAFDKENEREWRTGFEVVESRNGWFRISGAYNYADNADIVSLKPAGWIHGSKLGFEIQGNVAFAEPDPKSKPVVTDWLGPGTDPQHHRYSFRNPVQCKGHWVQLSVTGHDKIERTGWARGICGNQETTCDGGMHNVHGDNLPDDKLPRAK